VHVTYRALHREDVARAMEGSPIGARLPDLRVYLLDRSLQPVPIGVAGEIYVGGAGVARGYLNRPELTSARFVPDPFSAQPGARLYKAGDLGRFRADGSLEYLGRNDEQVKIRGFRIELGEIEANLLQHPGVQDAHVLVKDYGEQDRRIVAYLVPSRQSALPVQQLLRLQREGLEPEAKHIELPNGLTVLLHEDHRLPLVAVDLWYHVGPLNERPGRTGFAHLFEHMMFEGSKHVGKAHFKYLEAAGASDINGTTEFDRTNYFETLPSNQLELALWLESDRMGYLLETLDRQKLANQRDVVRNEQRQSVENQPYGLVEEGLFHQLFPKSHPYYADVIGSHEDVEAARLNDVREFFRQYYSPNNASLAITGDIDPAQAKALVERYFGSIPSGPAVPKITAAPPVITSESRITVTDQVELPKVYMGWITAPIYKPGDAEADLLAQLLGGGKASRLYKSLVYEKQIAQDVDVQNQSLLLGSVFEIQATAKPGVKPEDLEKAIDEELDKLRKDGPTQAELDRARNLIESNIIEGLERLGGFGGKADQINGYYSETGDPDWFNEDLGRYRALSASDIRAAAIQYLPLDRRVELIVEPEKKQ